MRIRATELLLAIAVASVTLGQQPQVEPLLAKIATYDYGQSREPLAQFTNLVEGSLRSPAVLGQIEGSLLKFLQSDASPAAKDFAFRELSLIATEKSVPLLTGLLTQPKTADMARYALTRIPGSAADDALVRTLAIASGSVRIGIINSLGQRRTQKSVRALAALLISSDPGTADAAAAALSDIGNQAALDALASARSKTTAPKRERFTDAYIRCASRLENKTAALNVYRELIAPAEPDRIRIAALSGLIANDRAAGVNVLTTELDSKSPEVQAAAIRLLSGIPDPKITTLLVQHFPKLSSQAQIRVLAALADRGDTSAAPLFVASLKDANLRAPALAGLGKVGNTSSIAVLADAAATGLSADKPLRTSRAGH
jgi:HEAT repeat protein